MTTSFTVETHEAPSRICTELAQRMNEITRLQGECSLIFTTWLLATGRPLACELAAVSPEGLVLHVPAPEATDGE